MNDLLAAMRSRPPPLIYSALLLLGVAMAPYLLSMRGDLIDLTVASRRSLSNDGPPRTPGELPDLQEFSTFQRPEEIDRSIEARARKDDGNDRCSRLFLYLPSFFADHGHGSQVNTYLMGATTSAYLDRAMLLVEPPPGAGPYDGGSQFGCPADVFGEDVKLTSLRAGEASSWVREDFPTGFSRLVMHPAWLSHGCGLPCKDTHSYGDWQRLANSYRGGEFNEITCENPDGTTSNVVVTGGSKLRQHFREHEPLMTRDHPSPGAERWAVNLGATPREAALFSEVRDSRQIWDFVLGLVNKAGFLRLQPWIARDVEVFLSSYDIPLDEEFSAVHVRRGDKLEKEARGEVIKYWRSHGHTNPDDLPTDYVPFAHYLAQWDGPETCPRDSEGKVQTMKQNIYIATDDPVIVRQEVAALPDHIDDRTVLWNECHQLSFFFNPTDESAFHLNGDGERGFEKGHEEEGGDTCFSRYHRNIVSVADMMVLSKAKTFIGEFNSNWGRVIRTMRVQLKVPPAQDDSNGEEKVLSRLDHLTKAMDTRVAWGSTRERAPGY